VPNRVFVPGDVLLFRWRDGLPAKHCGIATAADAMVHAHQGASVAEVAIRPWWHRHLAHVFRFPSLRETGEVKSPTVIPGEPKAREGDPE
jgi:NlpC/P60 family putative phage cell wall peptidase